MRLVYVCLGIIVSSILAVAVAVFIFNSSNVVFDERTRMDIDKHAVSSSLNKARTQSRIELISKDYSIADPQWYVEQSKNIEQKREFTRSESSKQSSRNTTRKRVITYSISTKGKTRSNLSVFSQQVNETLNHKQGWSRLGLVFKKVSSGGSFNLILSEASKLPSFSSGCSAEWSCRVGVNVIINDDRWSGATTAWNQAGGSIRDYRHMVINHEIGHWLGHGHSNCSGAGRSAPIMQQQSINLQGCRFNPWPHESEVHSPALGIR